jgi:hypothetical protein
VSGPDEVIEGPIETVLLLARLEQGGAGPCVVCQHLSVWRHPQYGSLHPRCCPRALVALEIDGGASESSAPRERVRGRRGAYDRRRAS